MDLFVVPTISFRLLYALLILQHGRRQILWLGVTAHPTAEWIAHQLTESYGWAAAPRYIVRDRDAIYGDIFTCRLQAMGIRDRPTRLDQAGLLGSCRCVWRAASSPPARIVSEILQRGSHAFIAQQGRAGFAGDPGCWRHRCQATTRRIAPSIRPNLISGRDRPARQVRSRELARAEYHRPQR